VAARGITVIANKLKLFQYLKGYSMGVWNRYTVFQYKLPFKIRITGKNGNLPNYHIKETYFTVWGLHFVVIKNSAFHP